MAMKGKAKNIKQDSGATPRQGNHCNGKWGKGKKR